MKKYSPFMVLCAMLVFASCSKPPINNDPVIGIWTKSIENSVNSKTTVYTEYEWIFNDAYLGRHHQYENSTLTLLTDFSWSKTNDIYTISYPGTDLPDDIVILDDTLLKEADGHILAERK